MTEERTNPERSREEDAGGAGSEERNEGSGGSEESGEPIGPFPTWRSLYATVLVWTAVTVVALYAITVLFDRSLP